jgi:mutator protein MutT
MATAPPPAIEVSAGLLFRDGKLLLAQRLPGSHLAGLWEFPGGKREPGETFEDCLIRELSEELGVDVRPGERLLDLTHSYPTRTVRLVFLRCSLLSGEPRPLDSAALAWVGPDELLHYPMPPADQAMLELLRRQPDLWPTPPVS